MQGYTKGANFIAQNQIRKMAEMGKSAKEISAAIRVELSTVEKFMDHLSNKNKPIAAPAKKGRRKAKSEADLTTGERVEDLPEPPALN